MQRDRLPAKQMIVPHHSMLHPATEELQVPASHELVHEALRRLHRRGAGLRPHALMRERVLGESVTAKQAEPHCMWQRSSRLSACALRLIGLSAAPGEASPLASYLQGLAELSELSCRAGRCISGAGRGGAGGRTLAWIFPLPGSDSAHAAGAGRKGGALTRRPSTVLIPLPGSAKHTSWRRI